MSLIIDEKRVALGGEAAIFARRGIRRGRMERVGDSEWLPPDAP
jgi:hypothetical protein